MRIVLLVLLLAGCGAMRPIRLSRVVLYQSGVGYFERSGTAQGPLTLNLAAHEVDDAITTLTVVDPSRPERSPAPSAIVPRERAASGTMQALSIDLGSASRELTVVYAAPTAAWRASYRLVLPERRGADRAWLQAWAVVDNTSAEDWRDVSLTLATDAPLSFAVDLRTPRLVERPNVTGYAATPIALGPIRAEHTTRGGTETVNGYADTDRDGILDEDDRCPDEGESQNGMDDGDGCPDAGRVVVQSAELRILEQVLFAADSSQPSSASQPVLDAIASTLRANSQIARIELAGHADPSEDDPWRLSAERAAAVRAALADRGIDVARLEARPYGDTQPIVASGERNRRVELHVENEDRSVHGAVRSAALARTVRQLPPPSTSTGGTHFRVPRRVTIPAGTSSMVTILNRAVSGEDVLLFRVDPNAPESDHHPFRAARLVNRSGIDLVPGPVSLFQRGELAGQGLLDALRAGQNAFVPYAVDRSTHVASERQEQEVPARILSLSRGALSVERTAIRRTRYRVEAGYRVPARMFVRHPRAIGYEPHALPPRAETSPEALLVPLPLTRGRDAVLTVEEHRPVRAVVPIADDLVTDLRPFVEGSDLDPALASTLRQLLDDRDALRRIGEEVVLLRTRLVETAARSEELRRSVHALDERGGRSSAAVRRRLTERLDTAVRQSEELSEQLANARARQMEALARLREAAQELVIEAHE